jgi:tetratricopeptide (TPR) repeat protein
VGVHRLTGIGAARGRLDISRERGFSKFVGRDDEMHVLQAAWEQSLAGRPQVIGIVGEAGVGKSRLCDMFMRRCRAQGAQLYHTAGLAHATSTPLVPVLHIMRAYFDVTDLDSDQMARERIAGKLLLLDERFADDLSLLFDFLGVPDPERPATHMDPETRQRRLLDVTKRLVRAQSARAPGVSVFEDLHWFDPGSELFVAAHLEAVQGGRSLTILNFRPDYHAQWMSKSYYRQMALEPLGPEAINQLLADLLGSDPSLDGIGEVIRERTGGNPFFIEEVVQSLVESGCLEGARGAHRLVRPIDEASVPASVQAVLAARIDRLAERDKAVLQGAAVIGKEFPEPVLARVTELGRSELEKSLEQLVSGEYIYAQELYPEAVYAFKHPLTQEVAYGSQLGARRAQVHAAVARAMEAEHPDRLDEWAALLVQHWELAGESLEAAHWHARAAAWAGSNDPVAALGHWRRVRELTDAVPESAETLKLGLSARIFALGYGWRLGIPDREADALFDEADRMAERAQDVWSRTVLLSNLGTITYITRGRFREAITPVLRSISLADGSGDAALYLSASGNAYLFFLLGEYQEALTITERAIELADGDASVGAGITVQCPLAQALMQKGAVLCEQGRLDEGGELIERGRRMAADRNASELVGWGHNWAFWHAYRSGDGERAMSHPRGSLELADRIGDAFARTWAPTLVGIAAAMLGRWQDALDAVALARAVSPERRVAADAEGWSLLVAAEADLNLGRPERALETCREAVALIRERELAMESVATITLARVLLGTAGLRARDEIEAVLARAEEVVRTLGTVVVEPLIHEVRSELAQQAGDVRGHEHHVREAHRLFVQMGATGHVERLERTLAAFAT